MPRKTVGVASCAATMTGTAAHQLARQRAVSRFARTVQRSALRDANASPVLWCTQDTTAGVSRPTVVYQSVHSIQHSSRACQAASQSAAKSIPKNASIVATQEDASVTKATPTSLKTTKRFACESQSVACSLPHHCILHRKR